MPSCLWSFLRLLLCMGATPTEYQKIRAAPTEDAQVKSDTGAASAVPPVIEPIIQGSGRARVITPYRADAFERRLRTLNLLGKHPRLPAHIRGGFPMGKFLPLEKTYVPDNYAKRPEHRAFIKEYVREQVSLRHMEGPYDKKTVKSILQSEFKTSPLFVIDKAGSPGKFRLVQDYSHKDENGISVNDAIDTDDYPTEWGNAHSVAQIIATAPKGTQAATLDVDSAFRNIPVLPEHKPNFVVCVKPGEFYIDHVCPFGVASGSGVQAEIMNAIVDILAASNSRLTIRVWVDDVIAFRSPSGKDARGRWTYDHDIEDIFEQTKDLGVPWKLGKCFRHADRVVYVGLLWDLRNKSVSVPDGKRKQHLADLNAFCNTGQSARVSLKNTLKIMGGLSHLTFVYTSGRAYLPNLTAFVAKFPTREVLKKLPKEVMKDLQWWQKALMSSHSRSLKPRSARRDPGVVVCASMTWGIGLIIGQKWAAWQFIGNWASEGRDIAWAGTVALELACLCLECLKVSDAEITIHSGEAGSVNYFRRGRSRNPHTNLSIRRIAIVCAASNIELLPKYVEKRNNAAEPISRGVRGADSNRLSAGVTIPEELRPFLRRV